MRLGSLPSHKTVREINLRLEKGILYHNSGYVRSFIGSDTVFRLQQPDSDKIHYPGLKGMFCNCLEYANHFGRIRKLINSAMISYAVERGTQNIERDGFKFLQLIKESLKNNIQKSSVSVPIRVTESLRGYPKNSRVLLENTRRNPVPKRRKMY